MRFDDHVQKWWKQANYNISKAKVDLDNKDFCWVCEKSHKAVELALKALILKKTPISPKKIRCHEINKLFIYLESVLDIPPEIHDLSFILDKLNVKTPADQSVSCLMHAQTGYFDYENTGPYAPYEVVDEKTATKVYSAAVKFIEWIKGFF